MRLKLDPHLRMRILEAGTVIATGIIIASIVGFLQNSSPPGDDALYYLGMTRTITSGFPYILWDPHLFAGYIPVIALSWVTHSVPVLLTGMGFSIVSAFHLAFVGVFILFGLSVYYYARVVGSGQVLAFSMVLLAWSTSAYWNIAIWGGAYDRLFTIPFLFFALAATYRYVSRLNAGGARGRDYVLCLVTWTLICFGDVFITIAAGLVGAIFLLLSAGRKRLTVGIKRSIIVFAPVTGFSLWQMVPILLQALSVAPFRLQYTVPVSLASLFVPGSTWVSSLNYVYLPLITIFAFALVIIRRSASSIELALLTSLAVMGIYWAIMGWVPSLWPFLPRLMATYNSVENLAWILLLAFPVLFAVLRRYLSQKVKILFQVGKSSFSISGQTFQSMVAILILSLVICDALVVLPAIKPVYWTSLSDQLNTSLNSSMGTPSTDYRVSMENRFLTRSFLYYQPDRFDTGGRVENLDPNPFFNNWYLTDIFYKNDLGLINNAYVEDRPPTNMSSLLESPYNFAGENFWLDWYGVNGVAFYPYALGNTVGNYTSRPSIFSTNRINTTYGVDEVIVKPTSPSPILIATNSTVVGFYSISTSSESEYQTLISMLSKMGLGSRYVIPIYLPTIHDALGAPLNLLVTDSSTYSQQSQALQPVFDTSDVLVISSTDGSVGSPPATTPVGSHSLVNIPDSFSQLLNGQEPAAYSFANSTRLVPIQKAKPTGSTYYPAANMALGPSSWTNAFQTPNAQGTLQTSGNSLIVNLTNTDPSTRSQFDILSHLPNLLPLAKGLTVRFSIQSSANITLGTVFASPPGCCPNYVGNDTMMTAGVSYQMVVPFTSFSKWQNSTSMFGITQDLTFAINLAPREPNTIVRLTDVAISSPAYTIATLSSSVPLTSNGVMRYSTVVSGVGLLASTNSSTAILSPSGNSQESVVTISSLNGGQGGQQYDRVITVGGNQTITPSIELFSGSGWSPVHEEWTNNQNMVASKLPQGFKGIVWKETYTPFWTFTPQPNGSGQPLPYYYAGPGMIYVPLSQPVSSIGATFNSTTPVTIVLFSSSIATLIIMAIFRKKLTALGRQCRTEPPKT